MPWGYYVGVWEVDKSYSIREDSEGMGSYERPPMKSVDVQLFEYLDSKVDHMNGEE